MDGVFAWLAAVFAAIWPGPAGPDGPVHYGYVEADAVEVAPARSGTLAEIAFGEGDTVAAGAVLFRLDDRKEAADVAAAEARLAAAAATLQDRLTGSRAEEIEVLEDARARADADLELARANFERSERLRDRGVASAQQYDRDRAALRSAEAEAARARAQLSVARLPARPGQVQAAKAEVRAAEAALDRARAVGDETRVTAPLAGTVERVYFDPGEQVSPAAPVVSVLGESGYKVRFFVPAASRGRYLAGSVVSVGCEGCGQRVPARVTRVASEAEFTPPVIYSLEERSRLVFAVEAAPENHEAALRPGQPVDVRPVP